MCACLYVYKYIFIYNLELTCDTNSRTVNYKNEYVEKGRKDITFQDIDLFK